MLETVSSELLMLFDLQSQLYVDGSRGKTSTIFSKHPELGKEFDTHLPWLLNLVRSQQSVSGGKSITSLIGVAAESNICNSEAEEEKLPIVAGYR